MVRRILILRDPDSATRSHHNLFDGFELCQLDAGSWEPQRALERRPDLIAPIADAAPWLRDLLTAIKQKPIKIPIFPIVPRETDSELLALVSELAADFAVWPTHREEIQHRVARILGGSGDAVDPIRDRLTDQLGMAMLVGADPAFLKLVAKIPLIARSGSPVLITGETGTGKELSARTIHHLSRRRDFPFIAADCAALPEHLFENEMFGHARGAFTDAHRDQRGLIAMANGGTLFLDEIDSLSQSAQAKLLRFLQERTYRPLGSERFVHGDVNVLAASNHDLEKIVKEGRFRSDLFFRLNVLRLHLIPLRERRNDIPVLARHFVTMLCAEQGKRPKSLSSAAIAELMRADWPGNVRELYNVISRAVVFAPGPQIMPDDVAPANDNSSESEKPSEGPDGFRKARARAIEAFERSYVLDALQKHNGNITQSARFAHQDRRAFGRLVKRYGIDRKSIQPG